MIFGVVDTVHVNNVSRINKIRPVVFLFILNFRYFKQANGGVGNGEGDWVVGWILEEFMMELKKNF